METGASGRTPKAFTTPWGGTTCTWTERSCGTSSTSAATRIPSTCTSSTSRCSIALASLGTAEPGSSIRTRTRSPMSRHRTAPDRRGDARAEGRRPGKPGRDGRHRHGHSRPIRAAISTMPHPGARGPRHDAALRGGPSLGAAPRALGIHRCRPPAGRKARLWSVSNQGASSASCWPPPPPALWQRRMRHPIRCAFRSASAPDLDCHTGPNGGTLPRTAPGIREGSGIVPSPASGGCMDCRLAPWGATMPDPSERAVVIGASMGRVAGRPRARRHLR